MTIAIILACVVAYVFVGYETGSYINTKTTGYDYNLPEKCICGGVFWPGYIAFCCCRLFLSSIRYTPGQLGETIALRAVRKRRIKQEEESKLRVAQEIAEKEIAEVLAEGLDGEYASKISGNGR